jgi:predicted transcriptional regulator
MEKNTKSITISVDDKTHKILEKISKKMYWSKKRTATQILETAVGRVCDKKLEIDIK